MHDLLPHTYNLDAYRQRIGYAGPMVPTLEVLGRIAAHHFRAVPFENIDVLLGRGVSLDPADLERKIVADGRGGYCFEQNGLMLGILRQIGFDVRPLAARVRIALPRDVLTPRTHLFLVATLGSVEWMFDVGVGTYSLATPIRFRSREVQDTPFEPRRIVEEGGRTFHQALTPKGWIDVYEFSGEPMPVIDREVGNWWTSTNPNSKFRQNLMVARATADGERFAILNNRLTHRRGSDVVSETTLTSEAELLETLDRLFGLRLPAGTALPLPASPA